MNTQQIATLRKKYVHALKKVKGDVQNDTNDICCDTEHTSLTMTQKYPNETIIYDPFLSEKDFFDVLNRKVDCSDELHQKSIEIDDDARRIMFKAIFKNQSDFSDDITDCHVDLSDCMVD